MLKNMFLRVAGPTIFVSIVLLGSCSVMAVYLHQQQTLSAAAFGENVHSSQVAHDLEVSLRDLILVLRAAPNASTARVQVEEMHKQVRESLDQARRLADKEREQSLISEIQLAFEQHTRDWQAMDSTGTPDAAALESLIETIAREALPKAERLGDFNDEQIERSEAAHQRAVNRMTLGFAAVGGVGSLTGIVLGYTVAWSLRRSIHQLSVRVRDAADKLGQDLPTVTLIEDGDLHGLHHHMKGVVQEIERVVEQLQQRERELIRADQMAAVGQLAAGVAHELRNPLTSIKMLVQKNRRAAGAAGLPADNLKIIEHEIRRMERCLQTFLDFSRPSKPERRLTDLSTLIEHTFGLIEGRARNQQVRLQFNHPVDSSAVEVDADQIQQLLINLALNALDAMPRGGTLTFELAAGSMGHVELRASDTGCGISTTVMPRLFSPFVSGKETGLGLGLVVSRRIAEDHGGSLTANNRPGGGAYFTLRIPAAGEPVKL